MKKSLLLLVFLIGFGVVALWKPGGYAQESNVLTVKKIAKGPVLDGKVDALWKQARAIKIPVTGGANFPNGSTEVTLRAVYMDTDIFFLAQWRDKTQSYQRSPWKKQNDGFWVKLTDPNDKGGDSNQYYEDKFAMLWNINIAGFEAAGCMVACHAGEAG